MPHLIPHEQYAEDQSHAKSILIVHVLHRGFQTGAFLGIATGAVRSLVLARRARLIPTTAASVPALTLSRSSNVIIRSSGAGAIIGTGVGLVALLGRMWGREEIEWKDRSWRLRENPGQLEVDNWSGLASLAGVAWTLKPSSAHPLSVARVVGGGSMGSAAGVVGYIIWRYGVRRGAR